jgi:hypothetical protein
MSESRRGVSDGALLAAIGSVLGLALLIWLWGGIAGAAFGGGWPRVSGGQLPGILVRLPARLADPARAWPQPTRSRLVTSGSRWVAARAGWSVPSIATRWSPSAHRNRASQPVWRCRRCSSGAARL